MRTQLAQALFFLKLSASIGKLYYIASYLSAIFLKSKKMATKPFQAECQNKFSLCNMIIYFFERKKSIII